MNQQDSNIFSIGLVKSNQFKKVSCQMTLLLYGVFCRFKSHPGGRLVADARNQQPFEPGKWGLRVVLSGHFCTSLHVGHARRIRPVFNYRITDLEAQIKTNKTVV